MTHGTEADALLGLLAERRVLESAAARETTAATIDATLAKGRELDAATESFRCRHFPRRHRLVVADDGIYSISRTGRIAKVCAADAREALRD